MSISSQVEIIYTTLTIPRKPSCVLIDPELSVAWAVSLIAKKLAVTEDDIEFYTADEKWFDMTNDELRLYVSELAKENKLQVLRRHKPIQSYLGDPHNKLFLIVDTGLPSDNAAVRGKRPLPLDLREAAMVRARKRSHPSSAAKVPEMSKSQTQTQEDAIYNGRPVELLQPPIAIWHPIFAKFRRMMSVPLETKEFSPEQLERATRFMVASSELYLNETERQGGLRENSPFVRPGCFSLRSEMDEKVQPDGGETTLIRVSNSPPFEREVFLLLTEIRNEIGTGSADPLMQAQCAYRSISSSPPYTPIRSVSCCPAFLMAIAGPYVAVSGAVFTDRFISEPLLDYTLIGPQFSSSTEGRFSAGVRKAAHLIETLELCIDELEDYYQNLSYQSSTYPVWSQTWAPHFRRFDITNRAITLEYIDRLAVDDPGKAVYKAFAKEMNLTVTVKFTAKYNQDAHRRLAEAGLAPKLWFCERIADVGGLYVVVMDYVEHPPNSELDDITSLHDDYPGVIHSLRRAVQLLHEDDLVFGDLREPNILVCGKGSDASVMLVDFDWCGKEGEARYPCSINLDRKAINWHRDVCRGGFMKKEHDRWMFWVLTDEEL